MRGGAGGGGPSARMNSLQQQLAEVEQQVMHKYGNGGAGRPGGPKPGGEGQRQTDQVQIYLRGDAPGARGGGESSASQAILMAELQTVRHLMADASMAMAENHAATKALEDDYDSCMEELRTVKQSWSASEMSLKVQTETVERLNAQVTQLTEELRVARDLQGEWRTKAEEYNLKLRGRGGGGGAGDGGGVAKQELLELEQKLAEVNRLRMLDAEQLAKQRASLERLEELEVRSLAAEKAAAECRRESDDWRNKAEGYAAELVAWRSKSEHWEATKAQSIRGLQQERDRLQNEWQMMRESLQSAEASLAVQTAAVQRLEAELLEEKTKAREMQRALEGWQDKEEGWRTEVLALRTRFEADINSKDKKIEDLQTSRDSLQNLEAELKMALQNAEASLAVQTAAVQRSEKQCATLQVEVRQCRRSEEEWRVQGEEARAEVLALQTMLTAANKKKDEAVADLQDTRERLEGELRETSKAYKEADAQAKLYMSENERLAKEMELLKEERRRNERLRAELEDLRHQLKAIQGAGEGGGGAGGDALKEVQGERDRLLRDVTLLRPKLSDAEVQLSAAKANVGRLEAELQRMRLSLGDAQGKAEKYSGEVNGYRAEIGGLRMQLEDCMARSEHAIATLREERDLLHSELERLRNALQAASAEVNIGMQAVAKLSNVDARTVSSQVRVYGESQGMQSQLHSQMDNFRRQISAFRGGPGDGGAAAPSHGPSHDEFRPGAGRQRRTRFGRPDGGEAARAAPGAGAPSGMAGSAGSALRPRAGAGVPDGGVAPHGKERGAELPAAPGVMHSARVHRPHSGKWAPPPKRLLGKSAQQYTELAMVAEAAEWLADARGRPGAMPSDADLRAHGMSGVADAIALFHGGFEQCAARLGLQVLPPPPLRTYRTRRVPHPVLIGHAAFLTPY
jgi:chromosome segregation ATPase